MANTEHDKPKLMNPRKVMRDWMRLLPGELPGALTQVIQALWCYSNDVFLEEDLLSEESSFTTTRTSFRQLAEFTHFSDKTLRIKLNCLKTLGLVEYEADHNPLGTVYKVYTSPQEQVSVSTEPGKKRSLAEMEALFNNPDLLDEYSRNLGWDEPEEPEADESNMWTPWEDAPDVGSISPWEADSATHVPESDSGNSEDDSGTFKDDSGTSGVLTPVLSVPTPVHGPASGFDLANALASSGKNALAQYALLDTEETSYAGKSTSTPGTSVSPDDSQRASAPVNPTPRGVAPNPTGTSRPETHGTSVSPAGEAPSSASPQRTKPKPREHKWNTYRQPYFCSNPGCGRSWTLHLENPVGHRVCPDPNPVGWTEPVRPFEGDELEFCSMCVKGEVYKDSLCRNCSAQESDLETISMED
jgi:hypothetical protein